MSHRFTTTCHLTVRHCRAGRSPSFSLRRWVCFLLTALTMMVLCLPSAFAEPAIMNISTGSMNQVLMEEGLMPIADLPEEWAFCFQEVDPSLQILLPYIRGSQWHKGWQEEDAFLPVLLFDDSDVLATLYFLKKDAQAAWHTTQIKSFPDVDAFLLKGNAKLRGISHFSYFPRTVSSFDGEPVEGSLQFAFTLTDAETEYSISYHYTTSEQAASGWILEMISVLSSSAVNHLSVPKESCCFPGIRFDSWNVVYDGNTLQYHYVLNDQSVLEFHVVTPYAQADFDLFVMDELSLLDIPHLYLSTEVDTNKHGNGKPVNLRDKPEGRKISTIPNGVSVQIANLDDDWCLVKYDELWGFVDARFLVGTDAYES